MKLRYERADDSSNFSEEGEEEEEKEEGEEEDDVSYHAPVVQNYADVMQEI